MEQTLPPAGLTPQAVDRETFQRVWRRVMPDQERSPIALGPAEQTAKQGGRSAASPQGKKEYPRPIPAREPDRVPTKTAPSPVPAAPLPRNDRERLHHLIDLAQEGISMGQMLARRGGNGARNLSVLVSDRQRAMRQLSAACFLVTGQRYQPPMVRPALNAVLALALRDQFLWEQRWARACLQTAEELEERSLQMLCRELAQEAVFHNRTIRRMLEGM